MGYLLFWYIDVQKMFNGPSTIKILTPVFTGSNIFQVNTLKKEVVWPDNICDDEYLTNRYRDVSNVAGKMTRI